MSALSYSGYRFPPDIIQRAVWMYLRFTLSYRDVEELLAERGIVVTYEPAFSRCARCRVRCEANFGILHKGIVGTSGAGHGSRDG
jgi:hypothetical protein